MTAEGLPALPPAAKIVDWGQLLEVVIAGLLAGVGVSVLFSLVLVGTVRAAEAQQQHRAVAVVANGALAVVALLACVAAVVFGVSSMMSK